MLRSWSLGRYGWWAETYHAVSLKDSLSFQIIWGSTTKLFGFFSGDGIFLIASNWFQFHEPVQSRLETVPDFSTYNIMQQEFFSSFMWSEELIFSLSSAWHLLVLVNVSASGTLDDHSHFLFQSISSGQKSFVAVSSCPTPAHVPAVTSQVENFSFRKIVSTTHSVTALFYQAECSS